MSARTPLPCPPITPAIANGRAASAITRSSGSRSRFTPSRVSIVSPRAARRTRISPPDTSRRSNAWSGCPVSSITRFVQSTTRSTLRRPSASRRRRTGSGEGPFAMPSTTTATYRRQADSSSTATGNAAPAGAARTAARARSVGGRRRGLPKIAASSRAKPTWPQRSGRFVIAVFDTSNTTSPAPSTSPTGRPTGVPSARTTMPSWPLPSPISSSAQIIPSLSTPRILRRSSVSPFGSVAPGLAKQTTCPSATFGAPHTTRSGAGPPKSTVQRRSRSALGWGSTRRTRAVTTPSRPPPVLSTPSTSAVQKVSRRAASSGSIPERSARSQSHRQESLIPPPPARTAAGSAGRRPSGAGCPRCRGAS